MQGRSTPSALPQSRRPAKELCPRPDVGSTWNQSLEYDRSLQSPSSVRSHGLREIIDLTIYTGSEKLLQ